MAQKLPKSLIIMLCMIAIGSFIVSMYLELYQLDVLQRHPISVNLLSGVVGFSSTSVVIALIFNWFIARDEFKALRAAGAELALDQVLNGLDQLEDLLFAGVVPRLYVLNMMHRGRDAVIFHGATAGFATSEVYPALQDYVDKSLANDPSQWPHNVDRFRQVANEWVKELVHFSNEIAPSPKEVHGVHKLLPPLQFALDGSFEAGNHDARRVLRGLFLLYELGVAIATRIRDSPSRVNLDPLRSIPPPPRPRPL